jgi:hypothetical protein
MAMHLKGALPFFQYLLEMISDNMIISRKYKENQKGIAHGKKRLL